MPSHDPATGPSALSKVAWRVIPFLCLLYIFNIIDRANVSFARLTMTKDVGLSDAVIDWGYGLFYIGYLVFEVPSNLLLRRLGARVWISRIMVSWGLVSMLTMAVVDAWSYYWARILLGVAEAGFFPGIIVYLTHWFPSRERARALSWVLIGTVLLMISAVLAYLAFGHGFVERAYQRGARATLRAIIPSWAPIPLADYLAALTLYRAGMDLDKARGFLVIMARASGVRPAAPGASTRWRWMRSIALSFDWACRAFVP